MLMTNVFTQSKLKMPTVLSLHRIGSGTRKKNIAATRKKSALGSIALQPTLHFLERLATRIQENIGVGDIASQLKDQWANIDYCHLHKDYRIVCKKYTFHLWANKELITVYLTNKKQRKEKERYHERTRLTPRQCMEYRNGKELYLWI